MIKNKRLSQVRSALPMLGQRKGSHVGFVISFVIFITFVVFMYLILNSRIDFGQGKTNSLEYVKGETIERISGNLTSSSVAIGQASPQNCVHLKDFFLKTGISDRFIVRSDSGNVLQSGKSSNDLFVVRNGNIFFRVYGSEEFGVGGAAISNCQLLSEGSQYFVGLIKDSREIFESKIIGLFNNYIGDYENLKKDMKISSGDEFGFRFIYNNGTEIKTPEKNITINIYVDRASIQYIKTDAARESGFMDTIVL